jgi:hypothetical protein
LKKQLKNNLLIPYLSILFIAIGLILQSPNEFINGFINITISPSILLTDYVALGGEGPALFNSGLLMLISYSIVRKLDLRITGSIFAGILTIGGFAFFGKNIINVSVVFIGVYLFTLYRNIKLSNVIIVFLFSTGLSPISSMVMFGFGIPYIYAIPLGILVGITSGFLLVELSTKAFVFHRGYNLYNVGFASGILSLLYFSILKLVGLDYQTNLLYTNDSHYFLLFIYLLSSLLFLFTGLYLNGWSFSGYRSLIKKSGRAVTDFTWRNSEPQTLINIGITGLSMLLFTQLIGIHINGPTLGGLMTISGFSAFGKHPRNVLPPVLGVYILSLILGMHLTVPVILAILFSTALAPIAGEFGIISGLISGMMHLPIVLSLSSLHGGVLLYSNGFAAAFTAIIMTTIITSFKKQEAFKK